MTSHYRTTAISLSLIGVLALTGSVIWYQGRNKPARSNVSESIESPVKQVISTETTHFQPVKIKLDLKKQESLQLKDVVLSQGKLRLERVLPAKIDLDPARHYVIAAPHEVTFEKQLKPLGTWVQADEPILELSSPEVPVLRGNLKRQKIQLQKAIEAHDWFMQVKLVTERIIRDIEQRVAQKQESTEIQTDPTVADAGAKLLSAYTRFRSAAQLMQASSAAGTTTAIPQKTIVERNLELESAKFALQGTIAQTRFETDQSVLSAKADLAAAQGSLEGLVSELRRFLGLDECSPEQMQRFLDSGSSDRFLHHAPADGILLERYYANGERAPAGAELLLLADLSRVFAIAELRQQDWDLLRLNPGDEVELQSTAVANSEPWKGRLELISSSSKEKTNLLRLTASFDNPNLVLRPGMIARVVIAKEKEATLVPVDALFTHDGKEYVVVREDDSNEEFEVVLVECGERNREFVELLSGPPPKSRVVTTGLFALASQAFLETEE